MHIYGPETRYPVAPTNPSPVPFTKDLPAYQAVRARLGLGRTVVVQPTAYGTDNAATMDAVAALGLDQARAVVAVTPRTPMAELQRLHAAGARGARAFMLKGGPVTWEELPALAAHVAPLGWHVQLYAEGDQLPELAPRLASLPVPVVVDHMGGVKTAEGLNGAGFKALLKMLESPQCWVKISGYRISGGPPFADVAPFARALLAAAPDRAVWGTDWPHPSLQHWMPEDGHLLDLLGQWAPSDAERRRVLVENPARLYGF